MDHVYHLRDFPPGIIGIPALDWMWVESAEALVKLTHAVPPRSALRFARGPSSIAAKRNSLVQMLLADSEFKWLLFLDSDMVPHPAAVVRLLSHDVDIVGATYLARNPPHGVCAQLLDGEPAPSKGFDGIAPVKWIGTGCLLVRRQVFECIPFPWFEHPAPGAGEDMVFCQNAQTFDYTVYADCGFHVGHMTTVQVGAPQEAPVQPHASSPFRTAFNDGLDAAKAKAAERKCESARRDPREITSD